MDASTDDRLKPPHENRRRNIWLALSASVVILTSVSQAEGQFQVQLNWKVPAQKVAEARDAVNFTPEQVSADPNSIDATRGLPALYILAGVAALPELANGLVAVYKNLKYGRTIITCNQKAECKIDHDPKGPDDTVVIVPDKGVKVQSYPNRESFDSTKWSELIGRALDLAGNARSKK